MDELRLKTAVVAGYYVGSFVSQTVAAMRPDLVKALVVSPPLPGAGQRVLELEPVKEFWYTSFHQLELARQLLDGNRHAVRAYLHHFWSHWSGPNYIVDERRIDHLADVYSAPGAFIASINWYRSSGNPVTAYAAETRPSPCDADDDTLAGPRRDLSLSMVGPARRLFPELHLGEIEWHRSFYPARGDGSICRSHQAAARELMLAVCVNAGEKVHRPAAE
jgi:pimeloyl-ACP methyl ester carboxylesterase